MSIFNSLGSNFTLGSAVQALVSSNSGHTGQDQLKQLLEKRYGGQATLVYKGREALGIGLSALSLPAGSQVGINGFTCFSVYESIKNAGLEPVYLDIEPDSLNFSLQALKKAHAQTSKFKVVIVQNTLGYPCDIQAISHFCQQQHLILIEDLAHSVGARYDDGQEAGTVGDLVTLSFSQDKVVDAVSGGALVVRSPDCLKLAVPEPKQAVSSAQSWKDRLYPSLTVKIRFLYPIKLGKLLHWLVKRLHWLPEPLGRTDQNQLQILPEWHAQLAERKFDQLGQQLKHRQKIAKLYQSSLKPEFLRTGWLQNLDQAVNLRFPIVVQDRAKLIGNLASQGFYLSDIWYDAPIAPPKYTKYSNYLIGSCPEAESTASQILNLPTHLNISVSQANRLVELINKSIS